MRNALIQQRAWVQHWIADIAAGLTPTRGSLEAALAALETHLTQDDATEIMKPTIDEHGNWTTAPATSIDGNDKRVIRASVRVAVAAGLNLDIWDHPEHGRTM